MEYKRGFTLIELLVVCGIMVVVSAIIFANNNRFGGQVLLQNFAYDVALSVRQAQVYGISVRQFGNSNFTAGYGMHFEAGSVNNTNYVLFADALTANGLYDGVAGCPQVQNIGSEFVQCTSINRNYFISKLCAPAGTDVACTGGSPVSTLDILFIRPEPDACIAAGGVPSTVPNSIPEQCNSIYRDARIVVSSPRGDTMSVVVSNNGQISVDQTATIAP